LPPGLELQNSDDVGRIDEASYSERPSSSVPSLAFSAR